ncbi:hypothetical protein [Gemmatimonas sp.]|uniref:hypothetical protein n=1 Tax=Gemmatimonas sp. TaxID=1962908 RepID=UPI00286B980D|nr:hypothetical protein [Gemmatimonas sp.]
MDSVSFSRLRLRFTITVAVAIGSLLVWQHSHGGVPSHSFLARNDTPLISNWWGALILPVLTWFLTGRMGQRIAQHASDRATTNTEWRKIQVGYALALLYAIAVASTFMTGHKDISAGLFQALPVLALFVPIFRAECVLGFVLGLTYSFGAVLPVFIASILSLIGAVVYLVPRAVIRRVQGRSQRSAVAHGAE